MSATCAVLRCQQPAEWRCTYTDPRPEQAHERAYCARHAASKVACGSVPGARVVLDALQVEAVTR